jgi:hypothetical protein
MRLVGGACVFELFVFDLTANDEPIDSPVGVRVLCMLPPRAHGPLDSISQSEELDIAGDVVWSDMFMDYILRINGLQAVTR